MGGRGGAALHTPPTNTCIKPHPHTTHCGRRHLPHGEGAAGGEGGGGGGGVRGAGVAAAAPLLLLLLLLLLFGARRGGEGQEAGPACAGAGGECGVCVWGEGSRSLKECPCVYTSIHPSTHLHTHPPTHSFIHPSRDPSNPPPPSPTHTHTHTHPSSLSRSTAPTTVVKSARSTARVRFSHAQFHWRQMPDSGGGWVGGRWFCGCFEEGG